MGCGSSSEKAETKTRLDTTEAAIVELSPTGKGDEGLDEIGKCAQELKYVMQLLIAREAKDRESIRRIELMSHAILGNLLSRLTVEELKKDPKSYREIVDRILKVAQDLDPVRATKATDAISSHVKAEELRIDAARGQKAEPLLVQIRAERAKLKEPKQLVAGTKSILDLVEKAHELAPSSRKVTRELLDTIVAWSRWILRIEKAWSVDYPSCQAVVAIAARVDTLAAKLVLVVEARWDPPMLPQVEQKQKAAAEGACASQLKAAEQALAAKNGDGAYDALNQLLTWWSLLKEDGALTIEVISIFSKLQTYANETYTAATRSGDTDTADTIRSLALEFDSLHESFDGLPDSSNLAFAWEENKGQCSICKKMLGKRHLARNHHCRLCGRCVCSGCSPSMVKLDVGLEPKRVCDICIGDAFQRPQLKQKFG